MKKKNHNRLKHCAILPAGAVLTTQSIVGVFTKLGPSCSVQSDTWWIKYANSVWVNFKLL